MGSWTTEAEMKSILTDIRPLNGIRLILFASHGAFYHAPEETLRTLEYCFRKKLEMQELN